MRNEDAFVCDPPLFAVTDGMGGAQAGELASRLAAAAIEERARGLSGRDAVVEMVREANTRIYRRALEDPTAAGMGTTATVALVDEESGSIAFGHVGDSRAYRLRDGTLEQLTDDHSLVGELMRSGRITREEAAEHPQRSVITRALGTDAEVEVDTLTVEMAPGDLYLICSDGLTAMVRDADVLSVAAEQGSDPQQIASVLVQAANQAGGEDNITVVVFEIVDAPPAENDGGGVPLGDATAESLPAAAEETPEPDEPDEPHEPDDPDDPEPDDPDDPDEPAAGVRRHGAGQGGRLLALAAIVAALAVAALLVYWGVAR